ncbi:MAG TPA: hypothetical protein VN894_03910 [Polyangiaceae bacterium]|nr:hypothetical protein [Polyangiaceae bacterium]
MNIDARVLRAMFRLTSRRKAVNAQEIAERAGARVAAVDASLRRLRAAGLAETRATGSPRLTLAGLAFAAALVSAPSRSWRRADRMSRAA